MYFAAQLFQESKRKGREQQKEIDALKKAVEGLSSGVLTGSVITSTIQDTDQVGYLYKCIGVQFYKSRCLLCRSCSVVFVHRTVK